MREREREEEEKAYLPDPALSGIHLGLLFVLLCLKERFLFQHIGVDLNGMVHGTTSHALLDEIQIIQAQSAKNTRSKDDDDT